MPFEPSLVFRLNTLLLFGSHALFELRGCSLGSPSASDFAASTFSWRLISGNFAKFFLQSLAFFNACFFTLDEDFAFAFAFVKAFFCKLPLFRGCVPFCKSFFGSMALAKGNASYSANRIVSCKKWYCLFCGLCVLLVVNVFGDSSTCLFCWFVFVER